MQHEINAQRLEEQKAENGFVREQSYPGLGGGNLVEYFGQVGLFAMRLNGKIFACDP
jgi:hypothetical protein